MNSNIFTCSCLNSVMGQPRRQCLLLDDFKMAVCREKPAISAKSGENPEGKIGIGPEGIGKYPQIVRVMSHENGKRLLAGQGCSKRG